MNSAQANVHRLEELQSFERIVAPFDGVITARNLDIGQLVTPAGSTTTPGAGTVSGSKEVFDLSAIGTLRVFINVPQIYAPDAKNGVTATLTLPQYPGRIFRGRLVRSSGAVDPATRTLLAEVDVDNRSGELLPGSYTEVHLNVSTNVPALIVPVSALILEPDGLHVATVDATNHAHIVRVTAGTRLRFDHGDSRRPRAWAVRHRQPARLAHRWRAGARGNAECGDQAMMAYRHPAAIARLRCWPHSRSPDARPSGQTTRPRPSPRRRPSRTMATTAIGPQPSPPTQPTAARGGPSIKTRT